MNQDQVNHGRVASSANRKAVSVGETEQAAVVPNNSATHAAAGNLAFLLSVIRCGETLHADEEANVREVIRRLKVEGQEFLKGICVYCAEVMRYDSLEQKNGDEGNQMRIRHIKQCAARPELKLIAKVGELIAQRDALYEALASFAYSFDERDKGNPCYCYAESDSDVGQRDVHLPKCQFARAALACISTDKEGGQVNE